MLCSHRVARSSWVLRRKSQKTQRVQSTYGYPLTCQNLPTPGGLLTVACFKSSGNDVSRLSRPHPTLTVDGCCGTAVLTVLQSSAPPLPGAKRTRAVSPTAQQSSGRLFCVMLLLCFADSCGKSHCPCSRSHGKARKEAKVIIKASLHNRRVFRRVISDASTVWRKVKRLQACITLNLYSTDVSTGFGRIHSAAIAARRQLASGGWRVPCPAEQSIGLSLRDWPRAVIFIRQGRPIQRAKHEAAHQFMSPFCHKYRHTPVTATILSIHKRQPVPLNDWTHINCAK